jgi:hypothetical protein
MILGGDMCWRTTRMVLGAWVAEADEAGYGTPGTAPEQTWRLRTGRLSNQGRGSLASGGSLCGFVLYSRRDLIR